MSNRSLYCVILVVLLAVTIRMIQAATNQELWRAMVVSEIQLLAVAAYLSYALRSG